MSALIIRPSVCVHTRHRLAAHEALRLMIEAGGMRAEARLVALEDRHAVELATRHQRLAVNADRPTRSLVADRRARLPDGRGPSPSSP